MNFPVKPVRMPKLYTFRRKIKIPNCIPFMQIILRELPRGGQLSMHGNVVNVPADVNSVVNTLPKPIKWITNHSSL